jgi:hypothetical protein
MRFVRQLILGLLLTASSAHPQSSPALLEPTLSQKIQAAEGTAWELQGYVMDHVPPQVSPQSPHEWSAEAKRLRQQLLEDIVFHGWPKEWVNSRPRFEDLGIMESGKGYRMRKLRYEIVPGFQSTGILNEPENLQGKVPAVLNWAKAWRSDLNRGSGQWCPPGQVCMAFSLGSVKSVGASSARA